MENPGPDQERIVINGEGAGILDEEAIESRATELAKMDGLTSNEIDLATAAAELNGTRMENGQPEVVDPTLGELTTWDEPVESAGHAVPRTPLENEDNLAEILVQEGLEEAEHDRRVAQELPDDLE